MGLERLQKQDYSKLDFAGQVKKTFLLQKTQSLRNSLTSRSETRISRQLRYYRDRHQRTTLSRIQLPHFFGNYKDWPPFRDFFRSVIGNDTAITKVEKFHYLKVSLKEEAEALAGPFPTICTL